MFLLALPCQRSDLMCSVTVVVLVYIGMWNITFGRENCIGSDISANPIHRELDALKFFFLPEFGKS